MLVLFGTKEALNPEFHSNISYIITETAVTLRNIRHSNISFIDMPLVGIPDIAITAVDIPVTDILVC